MRYNKSVYSAITFLIAILSYGSFAEYKEGIDTTDTGGYGPDSVFQVQTWNGITGNQIVKYYQEYDNGYFKYSFDEIKKAPENVNRVYIEEEPGPINYCFAIRKKDSAWMKIQIQKKLDGNRYVYKFGSNTTPNDRVLEKQDYDRSIKYKPNNLFYTFYKVDTGAISWDPPLPNNNHLKGYIIYVAKLGIKIDTTAPINLAQWDSIVIADTLKGECKTWDIKYRYYNIVAVYSEGKSDFLKGWTYNDYRFKINIKWPLSQPNSLQPKITIIRDLNGYYMDIITSSDQSAILSLAIYDMSGRQVSSFSTISGNPVLLNSSNSSFTAGLYIVKAMEGDKVVANQPFLFTR